ncbi:hypothetical protein [Allobacillus halotolerans]|uniref:Uracil-DNA glycosylase n=1 Tax=Allobacillus halotolerans TaxID=570278 RepID=A0ABS6GQ74_9BACI|nr:hypothetical protein [Allobacillus halotolerans]MBU6081259.1 hypothetical protein [Allobacillus halotolerans]
MKDYHCCATCIHFEVYRTEDGRPKTRCSRLGYDTDPTYKFNCWTPKDRIKKLMEKEK